MKEKKYKIYIHRDIEGKVFYVGCTKDKHRPNRKYGIGSKNPKRTIEWYNRCLNKFTYTIVADNLTQELAYELEEFLITQYGRIGFDVNGILVNKSIGGFGGNGTIHSEESKLKISKAKKGRKMKEEHKIKISNSTKGSKNYKAKKVICILSGKTWGSAQECAEENGINASTLRGRLNGSLKNNTTFIFV